MLVLPAGAASTHALRVAGPLQGHARRPHAERSDSEHRTGEHVGVAEPLWRPGQELCVDKRRIRRAEPTQAMEHHHCASPNKTRLRGASPDAARSAHPCAGRRPRLRNAHPAPPRGGDAERRGLLNLTLLAKGSEGPRSGPGAAGMSEQRNPGRARCRHLPAWPFPTLPRYASTNGNAD